MRNAFAEALYEAAIEDERVCIVVADISPAGPMADFQKDCAERFINVGVAEQTLVQASVDPAMRGRMLSLYTLIARGFPSIGALMMGYLASFVGLRWPVFGGAVLCLGLWVWARRRQSRMAAALENIPDYK